MGIFFFKRGLKSAISNYPDQEEEEGRVHKEPRLAPEGDFWTDGRSERQGEEMEAGQEMNLVRLIQAHSC